MQCSLRGDFYDGGVCVWGNERRIVVRAVEGKVVSVCDGVSCDVFAGAELWGDFQNFTKLGDVFSLKFEES